MVLLTSELGIVLISIVFFLGDHSPAGTDPDVCKGKLSPQGEVTLKVNDKELSRCLLEVLYLHTFRTRGYSFLRPVVAEVPAACVNARLSRAEDQFFPQKPGSLPAKNNRITGDSDAR